MQPDRDNFNDTVQCFLSYSRDDSAAMNNIAEEIKQRVEGLYQAKTGRSIRVFVDRQDLGWGEDWREKLAEAVKNATAFIPLVTMNYFNRTACREELMAFYNNAKILGVTDLILPIILAGGRFISEADPREEVRVVERLNHVSFESAWPRGFSSPEWTSAINEAVDKLIPALERAENRIAELEGQEAQTAAVPATVPSSRPPAESSDNDDSDGSDEEGAVEGGLYYLMHEFNEQCEKFGDVAPKTLEDLQEFMDAIIKAVESLNTATDKRSLTQRSTIAANAIQGPSSRLADTGTSMLNHLSAADAALRQIVGEVGSFDTPVVHESLRTALANTQNIFEGADEIPEQMDQIVEMVRFFQSMSVSLRRAVAPGYKGISAIRDAIKILKSWDDLSHSV
ncbi:toll/interleukin-1 receptor domain-containing protein [Micromonospora aurantiaca (nom. illeg.)]|uniref:toll/interleukin-1 receptor domain-containing protein n=1 Tax=Micromonospora aurantiaca (nom. illeg.) TaxID=47850 RepID=UPI003F4A0B2E